MAFKLIDLFSGIGGFSLGLESTGYFETVAFCEIEEFPRKVLKKHWADVPIYEDVKDVTEKRLRTDGVISEGDRIVVTGGFPCQDISVAGHQKGIKGERSGLWGELHRLIGEIRPDYAIIENVPNLLSGDRGRWFSRILTDMAEIGFNVRWYSISASQLGAPHRRNRVWILAYPNDNGSSTNQSRGSTKKTIHETQERKNITLNSKRTSNISSPIDNVADSDSKRGCLRKTDRQNAKDVGESSRRKIGGSRNIKRNLGGVADGLSDRLDGHPGFLIEPDIPRVATGQKDRVKKLKALGNSILPQIAKLLGETIIRHENVHNRHD